MGRSGRWPNTFLRRAPFSATSRGSGALIVALLLLAACASGDLPKSEPTKADSIPPTVRIVQPTAGARVEGDSLTVEIEYADQGSGVSVASFKAMVNDRDISGSFDQHSRGATGRLSTGQRLQLGDNRLTVEIADRAGNVGRTEISFLNPGSGWLTIAATLKMPQGLSSLALSPDGNALASGFEDGTIQLWQLSGQEPKQATVLKSHRGAVTALAYPLDGKVLASGGEDRTVRLWNLPDASPRATLRGHGLRVTALSFAPDGKTLASGSADRVIRLWDTTTAEPKEFTTLSGHSRVVSCLTFALDSKILVSGSADGTIRVWSMVDGPPKPGPVLNGHLLNVASVTFISEERNLASAGADRTIRLWDLNSSKLKEKAVLEWFEEPIRLLVMTSDVNVLAAVGENRITLWNRVSGAKLTEAALPASTERAAAASDGSRLVIHNKNGHGYLLRVGKYNPGKAQ